MNAVREAWTDDRLDDLANRMDAGFDRVDRDLREVRAEMRSGFETLSARLDSANDSVNSRFDAMNDSINARFDAVNTRFDALQRTLVRVGGGLATVVIASTLANHL